MGIDDLCHSGLVLGLGLSYSSSTGKQKPKTSAAQRPEPLLTLSLSGEHFDQIHHLKKVDFDRNKACCEDHQSTDMYGQDNAVYSLSNVSVKREREVGSEEAEIERGFSRVSEEDDDGSNGRKKLRLTKAQSALLEESFKQNSTLNPKQKQELARELKLRPRQVEVWFQNRRARTKLKQTEVDCELLKKCCETLTEENRRLQKELRALKLAQPLYMQLPAATLTMCPSCVRIGGSAALENAGKSHFTKPYIYNLFTNPSAAC